MLSAQTDLAQAPQWEFGFVVDALPLVRCYRVQPDGGGPTIDCAKSVSGGVSPIGVYDADTLTVGSGVYFIRSATAASGVIIACAPGFMWDPAKCLGDAISQGSNTGLHTETGFHEPFNLGGTQGTMSLNGGITDWSGRTPFDSLEIGEFNRSSELGTMIHLDSYMGFLRADEYTGIWCFYWDGLCRIAGQQFQEWAGPTEREVYDDEGETMYYHGIATYPWEHSGMLTGPYDVHSEQSADFSQNTSPHYGRIEPTYDDLQPFHRFRTYGGYLGQAQKQIVCAPVITLSGGGQMEDEHRYTDTDYRPIGLYESQINMSGHWGIRSALGFTIAKRPIIPVPKRIKRVQDADGDTPTNYKASDQFGSGSSHLVDATPAIGGTVSDDEKALYRNCVMQDLHAHLFNWEGANAFHYHEYDYYYPEESQYDHVSYNQEIPTWSDLNSQYQWYLDVPTSDTLMFDHRTGGSVEAYRNTAYFTITDEGGVCIGDGWGSEIRMTGGNIFLECAGDVFAAPGRNFIAWGGRDICLRAWNSVDISASEKDVRIKAEENLNMLGGNGEGPFGVFIESRGHADTLAVGYGEGPGKSKYAWAYVGEDAEHTGIVFKAKNSEIVTWARNIYMMTKMDTAALAQGPPSSGPSSCFATQPKEGDIVLDTKGKGDIVTRSQYVKHWVQCAVMHAWPQTANTRQVNFFTEAGATLCRDVYVDGDILNYGSHLVKDNVLVGTGHFYSGSGGLVTKADPTTVTAAINKGHNYEATLRTWSSGRWAIDLQDMWYDSNRPGNPAVVASAWFDMRIEGDYGSSGFTLWEARWAQMARQNGDTINQWSENLVESNKAAWDTYPFPGKDPLVTASRFKRVNLSLTSTASDLYATDRGSDYESPCTLNAQLTDVSIDGNYYHIGN